jgi:hypothetical protein
MGTLMVTILFIDLAQKSYDQARAKKDKAVAEAELLHARKRSLVRSRLRRRHLKTRNSDRQLGTT